MFPFDLLTKVDFSLLLLFLHELTLILIATMQSVVTAVSLWTTVSAVSLSSTACWLMAYQLQYTAKISVH